MPRKYADALGNYIFKSFYARNFANASVCNVGNISRQKNVFRKILVKNKKFWINLQKPCNFS